MCDLLTPNRADSKLSSGAEFLLTSCSPLDLLKQRCCSQLSRPFGVNTSDGEHKKLKFPTTDPQDRGGWNRKQNHTSVKRPIRLSSWWRDLGGSEMLQAAAAPLLFKAHLCLSCLHFKPFDVFSCL